MKRLRSISMYLYSLCFCLRYLPFKQAIKVPIYISRKVRVERLKKGDIVFACEPKRSMVTIGYEGTKGLEQQKAVINVENGKIEFCGYTRLLAGTSFNVKNGTLSFGDDTFCNANCYFACIDADIAIGDGCLFGWNIVLNTSNGHDVFVDGIKVKKSGDINIGRHVWICSYCHISKNVCIADGCIVAQNSLVLKNQQKPRSLIAGNPAKVIKENVYWEG